MLVLAVDTSGKNGSIALAQCGSPDRCEIVEVVPLEGGTFSAQLVPQIAALLSKQGFTKLDIAGFAVASGPGSFTGLRVGLAAIKALAEVLNKPIAVVSLLEALAANKKGKVRAALNAGRSEIYVADYDGGHATSAELLLKREELFGSSADIAIVTPDNDLAEMAGQQGLQVEHVYRPRSDTIARLGWRKILAGETVSPEALDANYVRRSDAEIFAKGET